MEAAVILTLLAKGVDLAMEIFKERRSSAADAEERRALRLRILALEERERLARVRKEMTDEKDGHIVLRFGNLGNPN